MIRSSGINGEGKLRGQLANQVHLEKWPLKWCVCVHTQKGGKELKWCMNSANDAAAEERERDGDTEKGCQKSEEY